MNYTIRFTEYSTVRLPDELREVVTRTSAPLAKVKAFCEALMDETVLPELWEKDRWSHASLRLYRNSEYVGEYHSVSEKWYQ